ncbi:MAG: class I SAM-dependent methyltransferase [Clostridiaceae bacterium]|nr:class I SAM-dependent methyltransferase [Clostridiaceae bacterium]
MDIKNYEKYISAETLMGPSCVRILEELFEKYPQKFSKDDIILDLSCGTGLSSLVIAKETGARVFANDLWIREEENKKRFSEWGIYGQVIPFCADANNLSFDKGQFKALISIDSYHYFAGKEGFFQEKILPFMKDGGVILIAIPGLKEEYSDKGNLLSDWLGDEAYMFKSAKCWEKLIGSHCRIKTLKTWEMGCFEKAWDEWFSVNNEYALGDLKYYETIIKPYTCFVGIYVKLK